MRRNCAFSARLDRCGAHRQHVSLCAFRGLWRVRAAARGRRRARCSALPGSHILMCGAMRERAEGFNASSPIPLRKVGGGCDDTRHLADHLLRMRWRGEADRRLLDHADRCRGCGEQVAFTVSGDCRRRQASAMAPLVGHRRTKWPRTAATKPGRVEGAGTREECGGTESRRARPRELCAAGGGVLLRSGRAGGPCSNCAVQRATGSASGQYLAIERPAIRSDRSIDRPDRVSREFEPHSIPQSEHASLQSRRSRGAFQHVGDCRTTTNNGS